MTRQVSHRQARGMPRALLSRRFPRVPKFRLARDVKGATVVEFALVAPVMCMVLLGAFDVGHTLYMRSTLQGILQKAARDATLETGLVVATQTVLDDKVRAQVRALANNTTIAFSRRYYRSFTNAAANQFEPFTDTNNNGTCNGGEPYQDNNGNGRWDQTGGNDGAGGAKDAMLYTVTVSYPRFFPIYQFVGGSNTTVLTASTVLRNQPYGDQAVPTVRNCT